MKPIPSPAGPPELRARAEAAFTASLTPELRAKEADLPDAAKVLLHELRVHQIELEMQNDELRRAQEQLDESRARYFDLYDLAPVGYVSLSDKGLIVQSNLTVARLLGVSRTDLDQRPLSRFVHRDDSDRFYRLLKDLRTTGEAQSVELKFVRYGGTMFWANLEASPRHEDGKLVIRVVLSDATARKQFEVEYHRLELTLQESKKMESLGLLAGGIAHDFNNLLTMILGSSTLAGRGLSPESPVLIHLQSIDHASHRAAELCEQMLDYSGHGRFVPQRIGFSELVESTSQMLTSVIRNETKLRFSLEKDLPVVDGDASQLRRLIMNLVINASESLNNHGGVIALKSGLVHMNRTELADSIWAPELPEGDYVFIEVSDNGCGINAKIMPEIFDPFFTTKFTGRGLGLAAVQGIVRGHRGALKVRSVLGHGTTFRLFLPATAGVREPPLGAIASSSAQAPFARPPAVGEWQGSGTVLVVDDEASIRMVTEHVLKLSGFDPVMAVDGQEALELFRADPDRFALVLLDLTMPRMGGEEAFAEMKKLRPDVKVVLMSGYDQKNAMVRFPRGGPVRFLPKPFTVDSLCAVLAEVLG